MEVFPHARISLDNGDLFYCTNVKYSLTNNAKLVHTLRQKGVGTVQGTEDTTVDIESAVGENGEEIDGVAYVKRHVIKQIRIKIPGRTITVNGSFTSYSMDGALDSEIKVSLSFIGKTED